jgi:hypothetical protein
MVALVELRNEAPLALGQLHRHRFLNSPQKLCRPIDVTFPLVNTTLILFLISHTHDPHPRRVTPRTCTNKVACDCDIIF